MRSGGKKKKKNWLECVEQFLLGEVRVSIKIKEKKLV